MAAITEIDVSGFRRSRLRRIGHEHGLSLVLTLLFVLSFLGQTLTGWHTYNDDRKDRQQPPTTLTAYLRSGHFGEATFENWESEFLQMACFVLLTVVLYQKGSSESKRLDVVELVDLDPRTSPIRDQAPWPVRQGGLVLLVYEHSLSLAFLLVFVLSFALHMVTGAMIFNEEQLAHGRPALSAVEFVGTSQFWFESFQNWQSEFLSLVAMVVLPIFLRQRGSPESKPMDAATWDTGR